MADAGVTTGGTFTWADQSGNGNNATQGVAANQPTFVPTAISGLPAVRFDGADDFLTLPTPSALGILSSDYEMFITARSPSGGIQFLMAGGVGTYELHLNGAAGARFIPKAGPDFSDLATAGTFTTGSAPPHIFSARLDSTVGSAGIVRVDGVDTGDLTANGQSPNNTALRIGRRTDNSFALLGDITEVLIYNRTLTGGERSQVEAYLSEKWVATAPALVSTGPAFGSVPANLSLLPGATAFAQDVIVGFAAHSIPHLNDGIYGNSNSWIGANTGAPSYAGVALPGTFDINGIAFGRDNGGEATQFTDRTDGIYTIQYTRNANPATAPASEWFSIGQLNYGATFPNALASDRSLRHVYEFDEVLAVTGVRILVNNNTIAIDEIEIFGQHNIPEPATAGLSLFALAALGLRRRSRRMAA